MSITGSNIKVIFVEMEKCEKLNKTMRRPLGNSEVSCKREWEKNNQALGGPRMDRM